MVGLPTQNQSMPIQDTASQPTHEHRVLTQAAELSLAVPQVIAHRLARMALAGATPSARDRREFALMHEEKISAVCESWAAMTAEVTQAHNQMAMSMLRSFFTPWDAASWAPAFGPTQLHSATFGLLGKGLAPIHRRATENAKRLGRTKLR